MCVYKGGLIYQLFKIRYSSKATWYIHKCCRLNYLRWKLHRAFNIWKGTCYTCAHIRQIIRHVHPQTLYSIFNKAYNINSIYYMMNLRILSLCSNWDCPTEKLFVCSISWSYPTVWLDVENGFGVENGSFIGDWISIKLFVFPQSFGWKVRRYLCPMHHNSWAE